MTDRLEFFSYDFPTRFICCEHVGVDCLEIKTE